MGELRREVPMLDAFFFNTNDAGSGFCWAAARDRGLFYLAAPEPVDGKDLGPGRRLSVIDKDGRLQAVVELPCPVHRFVVEEDRVFAIDDEGGLRIFEIVR